MDALVILIYGLMSLYSFFLGVRGMSRKANLITLGIMLTHAVLSSCVGLDFDKFPWDFINSCLRIGRFTVLPFSLGFGLRQLIKKYRQTPRP